MNKYFQNTFTFIFLYIIFFFHLPCYGSNTNLKKNIIIEGSVKNNQTYDSINKAKIYISNYSNYAVSNSNGNFKIVIRNEHLDNFIYLIVIHPGYSNYIDSIETTSSKISKTILLKPNLILPDIYGYINLNISGVLTSKLNTFLNNVNILINDNNLTTLSNTSGVYNFQPTNINPAEPIYLCFIKEGYLPLLKKIQIPTLQFKSVYNIKLDTLLTPIKRDTLSLNIFINNYISNTIFNIEIDDLIQYEQIHPNQIRVTFLEPIGKDNINFLIRSNIYETIKDNVFLDDNFIYTKTYTLQPKLYNIQFRFIDNNSYDVFQSNVFFYNDSLGCTDDNGNLFANLRCLPDSTYNLTLISNIYDSTQVSFIFNKENFYYRIKINQSRNIQFNYEFLDITSNDSLIYKPELSIIKIDTMKFLVPKSSIVFKEPINKKININFEHPYYLSFDTTIVFTNNNFINLKKIVQPKKYYFKAQVCDTIGKPIRNTKFIFNDITLGESNVLGEVNFLIPGFPGDAIAIEPPWPYYLLKNYQTIDTLQREIPITLSKRILNIYFTCIDSTNNNLITDKLDILNLSNNINFQLPFLKDYYQLSTYISDSNSIKIQIQHPYFQEKEISVAINENQITYFLEPIFLTPKTITSTVTFISKFDSLNTRIINLNNSSDTIYTMIYKTLTNKIRLSYGNYLCIVNSRFYREDSVLFSIKSDSNITIEAPILFKDSGEWFLKLFSNANIQDNIKIESILVDNKRIPNIHENLKINSITRFYTTFGHLTLNIESEKYGNKSIEFDFSKNGYQLDCKLDILSRNILIQIVPSIKYDVLLNNISYQTDETGILQIDTVNYGKYLIKIKPYSRYSNLFEYITKEISIYSESDIFRINYHENKVVDNPPIFSSLNAFSPISKRDKLYIFNNIKIEYVFHNKPSESFMLSPLIYLQSKSYYDFGISTNVLLDINEKNFYVEEFTTFLKLYISNFNNNSSFALNISSKIPYYNKDKGLSRGKINIESRLVFSKKQLITLDDRIDLNIGLITNETTKLILDEYKLTQAVYKFISFKYTYNFSRKLSSSLDINMLSDKFYFKKPLLNIDFYSSLVINDFIVFAGLKLPSFTNLYSFLPYEYPTSIYIGIVNLFN